MRVFVACCFCAAAAVSTPAAAQDPATRQPPAFRLGDAAAPSAYEVELAIDPREKTFAGRIRIELRFSRATPILWLNGTHLDIESAEFQQGGRAIQASVIAGGEDFVGFEPRGEPFAAGPAVADIRFRAPIEGVATHGLFSQKEGGEWYVISQFEAIDARRAFPCFDEPGWKTPWRVAIETPAPNEVVSNTPEVRAADSTQRPGWKRHEFAVTKPLPSYLVALAVGPFDVVDGGTAGLKKTRLRYFAPKGRGAEARFAKQATPRLLEILEDYFGMPYPFEKLDSVSIPQAVGFGAMENAGMITYASTLLLATPHEESVTFTRRYAAVAAHEIAHQWFGDLVTLAWWDDTWLNEAFATWMGQKTMQRYRPEWDNGWYEGFTREHSLNADRLASARRVRNPVDSKTDIDGAFDAITYDKGGAVLAMFESSFTPDRFRQGVRSFLERHSWGTATSQDFFRAVGEASAQGEAAVKAFSAFIDQPGMPLIDVAVRCEGAAASLEVSQQRLKPVGSTASDVRWTTPACFRYRSAGKEATRCEDIGNGKRSIALPEARSCPDWVIGNVGGLSHYVPRYDAALSRQLRSHIAQLPAHEAVALVVDATILAESGLMPIEDALAWGDAALTHPSPIVRLYAVELLRKQRDEWLDAAQARMKRNIVAVRVMRAAGHLGWMDKSGESDDLRQFRAVVVPFAAESEQGRALRIGAREHAAGWIREREAISANMTRPILETAARFADPDTYAKLEAAALATESRRDRHDLLSALGKVRDPALRDRALALALRKANGGDLVSGPDTLDFLEGSLQDDANRRYAFDYVRGHFDALAEKLPQDTPGRLMFRMGRLCTTEQRDAFAGFFAQRADRFIGGALNYRKALETMELCVAAHKSAGRDNMVAPERASSSSTGPTNQKRESSK